MSRRCCGVPEPDLWRQLPFFPLSLCVGVRQCFQAGGVHTAQGRTAQITQCPKLITAKAVVPKDVVPKDVLPRDVVPKDVVPKDAVPKDVLPKDVVPRDVLPKDVLPKDVVPKDVLPKRKTVEDGRIVMTTACGRT